MSRRSPRPAPAILLVDDDRRSREALRAALEARGFAVGEAGGGRDVVEACERLRPAALLLSLRLPDAADICARLQRLSPDGGPPVVALAEAGQGERLKEVLAAGAADFLAETPDGDLAAARLGHVLERHGARGSLRAPERRRATVPSLVESEVLERAEFLGALERAASSARARSTPLAVLCVLLRVADESTAGLARGCVDRLLAMVGLRLRDGLRAGDLLAHLGAPPAPFAVARMGEEEFGVLLEGLAQEEIALLVARRLAHLLAEPFGLDGREVRVSAHLGVASWPALELAPAELVEGARSAAFCAREANSDEPQIYAPGMDARARERMALEAGLRHALERGELFLHYQPRVEIATRRIVGAEALLRWRHPEIGVVPPARFIPLAESTGLIVPIGEWVLATACEQSRRWHEAGLGPLRISVNLSAEQFRQPDLCERIQGIVEESGLDPGWLELELTESILMRDADAAAVTLRRLEAGGIRLSIDDFGTGYSSLSYLKRFPIHALKIDQSFVRGLTVDPDDAAIATAILLMGRSLKLEVVAEGVETESQLSFLRIMRCDEAQGYLFGRPMAEGDLGALLGRQAASAA